MGNVRVGMVGSGYMGRTYAHCIAEFNEDAEVVAVTLGSRAPKLAADFGVDHLSNMTGAAVELPLPRSEGGFQFDAATVSRDKIPG